MAKDADQQIHMNSNLSLSSETKYYFEFKLSTDKVCRVWRHLHNISFGAAIT